MKHLTILFWVAVAGVGVSFIFALAMTFKSTQETNPPITLPLPATVHT